MPKFALAQPARLTDRATLDFTTSVLKEHFELSADGYVCQTQDVWQVVVAAAARRSTIEATSTDLLGAPGASTVRGYLNVTFVTSRIESLESECNLALSSQLPEWLYAHPQPIAMDLHDEPYYGQQQPADPNHPEDDPDYWICRGEARDGTTRFFRGATAYVMRNGLRMTIAVKFVHPRHSLREIVQCLWERIQALGIPVKRLYLDKGFCTIPVLRFLLEQPGLPVILAAPIRGKPGGLRALCQGPRSYRTSHTFKSQANGELTVPVGIVRTFARRRDGSHYLQWLVYVLLNVPDESLRQVRKAYRRRFGIETSYRLMEHVRIRTTSNRPAIRFLFMAVAWILINLWIVLHWRYLRCAGRGPRRVLREFLTLDRMARFLSRAVEAIYGFVTFIDPPGVKPAVY